MATPAAAGSPYERRGTRVEAVTAAAWRSASSPAPSAFPLLSDPCPTGVRSLWTLTDGAGCFLPGVPLSCLDMVHKKRGGPRRWAMQTIGPGRVRETPPHSNAGRSCTFRSATPSALSIALTVPFSRSHATLF